jgi:pyrimidine operon attenuation protein/uracil phosphoribosyltransferase
MSAVSARTRTVASVDEVRRALRRIAHEILERNHSTQNLLVLGIRSGGVDIARELANLLTEIDPSHGPVPCGAIDVTAHRDDLATRPLGEISVSDIPDDVNGKNIILVDDVLYTGRTVRAALNAIWHLGRPNTIQLAVLADRGHRELPIRADYVGKNLPSAVSETIKARLEGIFISQTADTPDEGLGL